VKQSAYRVDLPQLLSVCDANYIRLLKLVPALEFMAYGTLRCHPADEARPAPWLHPLNLQAGWCFGISGLQTGQSDFQVCIRIVEYFRYTQTLEIAASPDIAELVPAPLMQVRVYHDAASAEVISYQRHGKFAPRYARQNKNMYQQDEKLQNNLFLAEWLNLCLAAGASLDLPQPSCSV